MGRQIDRKLPIRTMTAPSADKVFTRASQAWAGRTAPVERGPS